ncbi:hypothetical protein DUNSADRAFT_18014 [Dunaliella salina]|uniref:Uncharacterized protein n=1 Tax=Dunaliella salina TaxID=3046 RepID=A0ABQ7G0U4_DUNSA|nr:hypothetical protein DUNSADRAFT_18014 [Dunaliella salina]|eukprot:KAF5828221.1 hypothetical protein DUNSADRAFT_18014 [Dunaliella salina]
MLCCFDSTRAQADHIALSVLLKLSRLDTKGLAQITACAESIKPSSPQFAFPVFPLVGILLRETSLLDSRPSRDIRSRSRALVSPSQQTAVLRASTSSLSPSSPAQRSPPTLHGAHGPASDSGSSWRSKSFSSPSRIPRMDLNSAVVAASPSPSYTSPSRIPSPSFSEQQSTASANSSIIADEAVRSRSGRNSGSSYTKGR